MNEQILEKTSVRDRMDAAEKIGKFLCIQCVEVKSKEDFFPSQFNLQVRSGKGYKKYRKVCRACFALYRRTRYSQDGAFRIREKARVGLAYHTNPEYRKRRQESARLWYLNNKEKVKEEKK